VHSLPAHDAVFVVSFYIFVQRSSGREDPIVSKATGLKFRDGVFSGRSYVMGRATVVETDMLGSEPKGSNMHV
jgi:hypothetical protein